MIRGMETLTNDPDWLTRFLGAYVKKNFLAGVHRGDSSDEAGTSYVPSLARGATFNSPQNVVHGYKPEPRQGAQPSLRTAPTATPPPRSSFGETLFNSFQRESQPLQPGNPASYNANKFAAISPAQGLAVKETELKHEDKPYRDRAELYAIRDGKIFGRRYEDTGAFGVYGGGIDPGEDQVQAALREFEEESGHKARNGRLLPVAPLVHDWHPPYLSEAQAERAKKYRGSRTFYVLADYDGPSATSPGENARFQERFYDPEEAIQLAVPDVAALAPPNQRRKEVLQHLQEYLKQQKATR
jgi:8-oxo-dGTP pyrophosphatase MutT (NUDIX family)